MLHRAIAPADYHHLIQDANCKVQRLVKAGAPGLVNFITAVAYHFSPALMQHPRNLGPNSQEKKCKENCKGKCKEKCKEHSKKRGSF